MRHVARPLLLLPLLLPATAQAQRMPTPTLEDQRLQMLAYDASRSAHLTAFPSTNLTVMLVPGDQIQRVEISDGNAFEVKITQGNDSLNILPLRPNASATLAIEADQRRYAFSVSTGTGPAAALLVRYLSDLPPVSIASATPEAGMPPQPPIQVGEYRLSGERALRPTLVSDDGERTFLAWDKDQSIPAVFGISPTGQEEVVDGYMRDGTFTIDRIYGELLFRIDKKQAKARRIAEKGEP